LDEKVQIEYHPKRATETSKFNPDLTKIKKCFELFYKNFVKRGNS